MDENNELKKDALSDAIYEIKTENITNEDLNIAELRDENTGELITTNHIEKRFLELSNHLKICY